MLMLLHIPTTLTLTYPRLKELRIASLPSIGRLLHSHVALPTTRNPTCPYEFIGRGHGWLPVLY